MYLASTAQTNKLRCLVWLVFQTGHTGGKTRFLRPIGTVSELKMLEKVPWCESPESRVLRHHGPMSGLRVIIGLGYTVGLCHGNVP